ncbi:histidine--tRNA ligase [Paenisporosarcina cavernae]|uniref:Histidine--tRNA ligase n=1 Tax=Paenisporosarcina cavernae TaxID=2320858 RepID=A0A385YVK8_9BACL|nr:histidine--tRNA ligase [Paenisporosarcina cavernae]AYC29718.1 histidine--tRNA ligase [Paenisporosarcina cavernae]
MIQIPRGTKDLLPEETAKWQVIEKVIRDTCDVFQYKEIRTPIFEHTDLFTRSVGDTTDIVQKEMYTFTDRGDRSLTLRPEGTASVVRSYVENKMFGWVNQPVKLYYLGPMFRYERQQAGRYRQFVQFGIEAIGSNDPAIDAEVMALAMSVYKKMGLEKVKLVLNSLGDAESRNAHKEALIQHFEGRIGEFCSDCQSRLTKNPLRILDCKKDRDHELMATAPKLPDYLNEDSKNYFEKVQAYLNELDIPFELDPNLVRGLDYYNHTAFEIMSEGEGFGSITTLAGGGRYNGLVSELGGPDDTPGIGFAMSVERLLLALEAEGKAVQTIENVSFYIAAMDEESKVAAVKLTHNLRVNGISAETDYLNRKVKAQMKSADRLEATYAIIIGETEMETGIAKAKNLQTGESVEFSLADGLNELKKLVS